MEQQNAGNDSGVKDKKESTFSQSAPTITLPKGGGAVRGIGEKFAANPVTGTGSMSVPIATSPGRSGFGPQLSLSYDSGAGNGPFGFGWSLSLPSITRKTDKGLPQYLDTQDSDVFILSGAEDLVPVYRQDASGVWIRDVQGNLAIYEDEIDGYRVRRYRPRIEGLFARIERWTNLTNPSDVHWRSISKDNILTLYGQNDNSRIGDPEDTRRIFSWLICETRDDKGNAVFYRYKTEDGLGVDLSRVNERNRGSVNDIRRTANRYIKHILYGNRIPLLDDTGQRPRFLTETQVQNAGWMFETVFDYGEHDADVPTPNDIGDWAYRNDPFSSYRSGFEVRTTRLCQRVLMFHHFLDEAEVGNDCLVRSTDFTYSHEQDPTNSRNPVYTFLQAVTQNGYRRNNNGYIQRSLPPVEFEYTQPIVQDTVEEVDSASLQNLPMGVDGAAYQWADLHGEGIPGILTEQADAWYYKRNLSPIGAQPVEFAPLERVAIKPNMALANGAQIMDLAGDGQQDLVMLDAPTPGLYEHDEKEDWQTFRPFTARINRDMRDPNLKFVDLDGDGHADVLITENDAFVWHTSLAEAGFGPAQRIAKVLDEENGPRVVFADSTQSIYLADLSGDGLTDILRIRNGEVCYWPNLGHGKFGAKISMDQAPWFDNPDQFDHKRIRLADIDGSGTTDIIYLHREGVRLYFNQSGNSWSESNQLRFFPRVDDLVSIVPTDLLGNGTACLVWSSALPGDRNRPMRYVNLMGDQKPHLLVRTINNLGAETRVHYAPSTQFYLQDKRDGNPWITKLPFPVHVVERVETYDHISRNRFVTRYAYHHGYFDGVEREFRGFGMVEQWDTEEFAALSNTGELPAGVNIDVASHVPPVHTKTWFHTGIYIGRAHVSDFFAGLFDTRDEGEYYRETGLNDSQARRLLLADTVLPAGLTIEEEREACRALKGAMLRQEVYADDGSDHESHPYTVTEQNFTIRLLQPRTGNRHAVFFTHPREVLSYHYERNPVDPRIQHAMTLEVDDFGNVLQSAAIGYGRRQADTTLSLQDRARQTQPLLTYTENQVTNAIATLGDYRTPLPWEAQTFELTGVPLSAGQVRYSLDDLLNANTGAVTIGYEEIPTQGLMQRRLIEHIRTLYRPNDLGANQNDAMALLPPGVLESLALPGESYKLALTPNLIAHVYGDRVTDAMLADEGRYVHSEGDANWWIPAGRVFHSPGTNDSPTQELAFARQHFFLLHRFRNPFHTDALSTESFIRYDQYDLLMLETRDALNNHVTAGERDAADNLVSPENDYRVLQPRMMMDPNRNRTAVAFDALGMVVGTALMGKPSPDTAEGDLLDAGFEPDLPEDTIQAHLQAPFDDPHAILRRATTRLIYDLFAYQRTQNDPQTQPASVYTLARETHVSDLATGEQTRIQHSFSYSDGFGREIQKKIQAEPGPVPQRDADGSLIIGPDNRPLMTPDDLAPRWVGSGWTVFNNKGKPVRQYEPFFTDTHLFEFDTRIGVSPVLFYDPLERVVATLHPNHSWEKVVFDPWRQESWDVNDTVLIDDPATDLDVGAYFSRLNTSEYLPTWHASRINGARGPQAQTAAQKAAVHAATSSMAHFDTLGRPFLTLAHNRFEQNGQTIEENPITRVELDIEGNQRAVIDALERAVMRYDYDMLSSQIYSTSMDAGERWILNDVAGNPIRSWDSRGHSLRNEYDVLRRPVRNFVQGGDVQDPASEILFAQTEYGETEANATQHNLRTRVSRVFDSAGVVTSEAYDFKGNRLRGNRQLTVQYRTLPDWSSNPALETESFTTATRYDALNRPITLTTPDNSIVRPTYNEANLLEQMAVQLRGASQTTLFVSNIDYNARGQRERISYATTDGSNVTTTYHYEQETFRLNRLHTVRQRDNRNLQDLNYVYDPVGNITSIRDDAQQTVFFNNTQVDPHCEYTYDALYRLIQAEGREHAAQNNFQRDDADFLPVIGIPFANSPEALQRYIEAYAYDLVGNILGMTHTGGAVQRWKRCYQYAQDSNRLLATGGAGELQNISDPCPQHHVVTPTLSQRYHYDAHGNIVQMPHLPMMQWNFKDQLQASSRQVVNGGTPEMTYYVYDAAGQRVRRVTERQATAGQTSTRIHERLYLGGFEIYREYDGRGSNITLERETLHVMDDKQRVAIVETRIQGNEPDVPQQLIRYQLGNHLGSASLELDGNGAMISYEEYHPYGTTAYQSGRSAAEVILKRYRYTGMERDEETGLNYHGARYYAGWLGRWVAVDPIGMGDGVNRYEYSRGNPVLFQDTTGNLTTTPVTNDDPAILVGRIEATENEGARHATARAISSGFIGIDSNEQSIIENELPAGFGTYSDTGKEALLREGDIVTAELPQSKIDEYEARFDAKLKYRAERILPDFIEGSGSVELSTIAGKVLESVAIGLKVLELGLTAVSVVGLAKGAVKLAAEKALAKGAEKGLIAAETKAVSSFANLAGGNAAGSVAGQVTGKTSELAVVEAQTGNSVVTRSAQSLANARGEQLVSLGNLNSIQAGERLSLVAHGNRLSLGGMNSSQLSSTINASGVRPRSIELVACQTGCGTFPAELASGTGAVVRAPLGNVNVLRGIPGSPQVRLPGTDTLLPPGRGFRVHLPVVRF
ncbi:MAG TPA: SpvB/TcaC N-terminal domain-containing protein [Nitrosomonas nitrosa]|nr:SpvB/TcaC N-terminal domain-containing protein [Nitrosomonas nitrosa]